MASQSPPLRVIFFPLMWQGHLIPLINMAKLFALRRCIDVGIITTPSTTSLIQSAVGRIPGCSITVHLLQLPNCSAALPEVSDDDSAAEFLHALSNFQGPFERLVEAHRPNCIISDMFLPWTASSAAKFNIPRLVFTGFGFFSQCVTLSVKRHAPHRRVLSDAEPFLVPNLPHQIELTTSQIGPKEKGQGPFVEIMKQLEEARLMSYGEVVNSFYDLEPEYVEYYKKEISNNVWHVGPVSSYNRAVQGPSLTPMDPDQCFAWLGSRDPRSVLYVCFGSLWRFGVAQMMEIASALEESGHPFIWVVGSSDDDDDAPDRRFPEGFEERTKERGLIIKGWAPQMVILGHRAVGAFVTHCGWNSVLEGVGAGVPMVTWPLFAEQFYNEKLVTRVLKIGVEVGSMVSDYSRRGEVEAEIGREKIKRAVAQLMDGGDKADGMRRRAKEVSKMAGLAMEEGGSSHMDLTRLINELMKMCGH